MRFLVRASRDLDWIAKRTDAAFTPKARAIAAFSEKTGRTAGMVAFDGATLNSIVVSIALDVPIAWRALARPTFEYPFVQLKKGVLLALVSAMNDRSLALTAHVGFRLAHRIIDGVVPGVDMVLFEMRREECRWLED